VTPAAFISLDIETRATTRPEIIEAIRQDPATYKIANNRPTAEKEAWELLGHDGQFRWQLDRTAVGPHAELLCITVRHADHDGRGEIYQLDAFDRSEPELLAELATELAQAADRNTVWIGHNARAFDLPLILRRWAYWSVDPCEAFPRFFRGYPRGRIYDTMIDPPLGAPTPFVSLNAACRILGVRPPEDPGVQAPERSHASAELSRFERHCVACWLEAGEFERILSYNAEDERATWDIFWKCTHAGRVSAFQFEDDAVFESWLASLEVLSELERDGYRYRHYSRRQSNRVEQRN
jgi:hypothetical protein